MATPARADRADLIAAFLLFAGSIAYLAVFPRNLGFTDEGLFLYEARRLLDGEIFFRDIYEIIPPGSHYLMALFFALFGTDIAVAKLSTAAIHGATAAATYRAARVAEVRLPIAALAAVGYVALVAPIWPYASPHWVGGLLSVVLLCVAIDARREIDARRAFAAGVVAGLVTIVQHQRGIVLGGGLALLVVVRGLIDRRMSDAGSWRETLRRCIALVAGAALVVVPVFALLLAFAGARPMIVALIEHPLVHYGSVNQVRWGSVPILTAFLAAFTFPRLLKYMPLLLVVAGLRLAGGAIARAGHGQLRVLSALLVLGAASCASVAYRADFIHLGFIAPLFLVAAAECVEQLARRLDRARLARPLLAAAALLAAGGLAVQLWQNVGRARAIYRVCADTAFGRVQFGGQKEVDIVRQTDELLDAVPGRVLFSYPAFPALYLLADGHNPTPYQLLLDDYSPPGQIEEAAAILERKQVPLVAFFKPLVKKGDPLAGYLRERYEPIDAAEIFWRRAPGAG